MIKLSTFLIIFTILISSIAFSQSSTDFLKSGIEKHNKNDYKSAIIDYTKVIELDKGNKVAYFNRGNCEFALKDYESAFSDFSKTIELDSKFADAYYGRVNIYVTQEKYTEALQELDKLIAFAPTTPNALTLRGQIRAQTGNKSGACDDFTTAKNNGDNQATKYLIRYCGDIQGFSESIVLNLPEDENWKIGDDQDSKEIRVLDYVHANETINNWTELINTTVVKGVKDAKMDMVMNLMSEQSKKNSPDAKLTFIDKDEKAEFPWIIFTVESPRFNNDPNPESQLWYIVQGKQALYNNFRAIKKAIIPNELKEKWVAFFKSAKVVYK